MEGADENLFVLNLIKNVEKNKCLYDKGDAFYYNKNIKERSWSEVAVACDRTAAECRHRWKLLRERFCKELKRLDAPSGSGMSYLHEWKFLQSMMFLKASLAPRRTRDNFEDDGTEILEESFGETILLDSPTTIVPHKRKKSTLDSLRTAKFGETIENIENQLISQTEQSADEAFAKTLVLLMNDLPIAVKDDFQASTMAKLYRLRKTNRQEMAKLDEKIGFIGGGNMAFAIGSGLINQGIVKAGQVFVSGPNLENLQRWRDIGVATTEDNNAIVDKSDIIFICVKPHILTPCAMQLRNNHLRTAKDKDKLFVSVLAGVNLKDLEESFSFIECLKMIRTMPNTPMQVGEGCTVYAAGSYIVQQDLEKVHLMLNSLGIAHQVPESMINAVSGVSGCGPAFVYTIIEALADGAVKNGVPRQMALQFATQTVLGAAKAVMITGKHPAVLRDEVCSPGGATIVGVHELEKGNLRSTLMNAVEKASERAAELGRKGK